MTVLSKFRIILVSILFAWPMVGHAQDVFEITIDNFTAGLEVDDQGVEYVSSTIRQSRINSTFGGADQTIWVGEAEEFTHTVTMLHLSGYGGAYVATHSIRFKTDVGIDGITGFSIDVPRNAETRIAYGPADNTSYQIEDVIDIPAVRGYGKSGNMIFGGVPFNYVWNRGGGVYVAVLATQPDTFELPISVGRDAVTLAHHYYPDGDIGVKTDFAAGEILTLPPIMVGFHRGDYFTPLRTYVQALEAYSGKQYIDVPLGNASASAPYWKTWGLDKSLDGAFSVDEVLEMSDILAARGIYRIMLDYGWFVTEGIWDANEDPGFDDNDDLIALIAELKRRGFEVGLWYQPLQVDLDDDDIRAGLQQYVVRDEDGDVFIDDDDLALLDPSHSAVRALVRGHMAMFQGWGVKHVYIDSQMAQLATPPNFALPRPIASHEALPRLYDLIREEGRSRQITVELCPDGRQQTLLNMPQAVTNIGDPNNDRQLRAEHRWLKAIQGSRAIIGTYVEPFPDNGTSGSFLNIVGIGGNLQSIGDPRSFQNPEWDIWIKFYKEHHLETADYQPLYDIAFDRPETHVLQRGRRMYYSFFAKTEGVSVCLREDCIDASVRRVEQAENARISQMVELRGLQPGAKYQVRSFPDDGVNVLVQPDVNGIAHVRVEFAKELMVIATRQ